MSSKKFSIGLLNRLLVPFVIWVFVAAYLWESRELYTDVAMLFVRWTFYTMVICTIFAVRGELAAASEPSEPEGAASPLFSADNIRIIIFVALMSAYLFLIQWLGFLLSTFLFSVIAMFCFGVRSVKTLVTVPCGLTLAIYLMFEEWLLVSLPSGVFGF